MHANSDPRFILSKEGVSAMKKGEMSTIKLTMSEYDATSGLCTFTPIGDGVRPLMAASLMQISCRPSSISARRSIPNP